MRVKRKKKQGMLYTKVLRLDSSERAREPKKKPPEKDTAAYGRERARFSPIERAKERERERERARKGRSVRSLPHRRRDACVRLSIYYREGERAGRQGCVGVRAKG